MEPKKPETVELPSIAEHQRSARVTLGRRPYGSFNDPMCSAVVEISSAGETVAISTGDLTPPEKGAATADYALHELEKTLLIALADVRCLRGELKIAAYQSLADATLDTFIKQAQAAVPEMSLPPVSTGGCSAADYSGSADMRAAAGLGSCMKRRGLNPPTCGRAAGHEGECVDAFTPPSAADILSDCIKTRDRAGAIAALQASGMPRQEAKAMTFGLDAIGKVKAHDEDPRCQTCGQPRSAEVHKKNPLVAGAHSFAP